MINSTNTPPGLWSLPSVAGSDDSTTCTESLEDVDELEYMLNAEKRERTFLDEEGYAPCLPQDYASSWSNDINFLGSYPGGLYYKEGDSPWMEDWPLTAQAGDWRGFRLSQKRSRAAQSRRLGRNKALANLESNARELLRKHGFEDASKSVPGWAIVHTKQDRVQNLIECQAWHLHKLEKQEAGIRWRVNKETNSEVRDWRQNFEDHALVLHRGLIYWIDQLRVEALTRSRQSRPTGVMTGLKRRKSARLAAKTAHPPGPESTVAAGVRMKKVSKERNQRVLSVTKTTSANTANNVVATTRYGRVVRKPHRYVSL